MKLNDYNGGIAEIIIFLNIIININDNERILYLTVIQ